MDEPSRGSQVLAPQMRQTLSKLSTRLFTSGKPDYESMQSQMPGKIHKEIFEYIMMTY